MEFTPNTILAVGILILLGFIFVCFSACLIVAGVVFVAGIYLSVCIPDQTRRKIMKYIKKLFGRRSKFTIVPVILYKGEPHARLATNLEDKRLVDVSIHLHWSNI